MNRARIQSPPVVPGMLLGLLLFAVASSAESLPEGSGRELATKYCSDCHGIERVMHAGGGLSGWTERIHRMIRFGAKIAPTDVEPLANYLASALPPRPRAITVDESVTTIATAEVSIHPIQTVLRVAGRADATGRILRASIAATPGELVAVGQRARAFSASARSSMRQARISTVRREPGSIAMEAVLAAAVDGNANYVLEIVVDRGDFLAVPNEAIINDDQRARLYVQMPSGSYVPREIEIGLEGERYTQVVRGLVAGERVVTLGNFFVDAEYRMKGDN